MRLLLPQTGQPDAIRWISRDWAIGLPSPLNGWHAVRGSGVHAVVDLSQECGSVGGMVRENGMRYLRLPIGAGNVPVAEELHIVTSWVEQRIQEGGRVLIHDASVRGNDAVVACAALVKAGRGLEGALLRLRSISEVPLSESQVELLHQFVAQRVVSAGGR